MIGFLRNWLARRIAPTPVKPAIVENTMAPPAQIVVAGMPPFAVAPCLQDRFGYPLLDWSAVHTWIDEFAAADSALEAQAWLESQRLWLLHLRDALGSGYRLLEMNEAFLLSTQDVTAGAVTLGFVARTRRRIAHALQGLAAPVTPDKDIFLVIDHQDGYYRYVSCYYDQPGEYAMSGGMFIHAGCPHFVTVAADLTGIEPVIVHELTHSSMAHLALPLWLDEGIAVNTERRLAGGGQPLYTAAELARQHRAFWQEAHVQQFWSGDSFQRTDEGNRLSYDMARMLVERMAVDWPRFCGFAHAVDRADAGEQAALAHYGLSLGDFVAAFLGGGDADDYAPRIESDDVSRSIPAAS